MSPTGNSSGIDNGGGFGSEESWDSDWRPKHHGKDAGPPSPTGPNPSKQITKTLSTTSTWNLEVEQRSRVEQNNEEDFGLKAAKGKRFLRDEDPPRPPLKLIKRDTLEDGGTPYSPLETEVAERVLSSQNMALIRQTLSLSFRRHRSHQSERSEATMCAVFNVGWDLPKFLRDNYEAKTLQKLRKVIAITGQTHRSTLTTVGEYFAANWKDTKDHLLNTLELALTGNYEQIMKSQGLSKGFGTGESISVGPGTKTITATGSEEFVISIAQQVAWLAAVFQEKKNHPSNAYVGFTDAHSQRDGPPTFDIRVDLAAIPMEEEKGCCWKSLLGPAVLVQGFPVPSRSKDMHGLEAKVGVMATICGIPRAVTFGGGFVFKGRCHALVPMEQHDDSIQWHILDTYPRKLEWEEIDEACPGRLMGMTENDALWMSRAFFGWCPRVLDFLGTAGFDYGAVGYSQGKRPPKFAQLDKIVFGGTQYIAFMGDFSFGRRDGVKNSRPDDYETILEDARATHVILYDTVQKRAVLTNAQDTILHLIHHRRYLDKGKRKATSANVGEPFLFADPERHTESSLEVMLENAGKLSCLRTPFSSPDPEKRYFKDEVKTLFNTIEAIRGNDYAANRKARVDLRLSRHKALYGWEYMQVLDSTETTLGTVALSETCGKWNRLAKDIGAVVLLASNLGDVFLPAPYRPPAPAICSGLASFPKGEDYLAVKIESIQKLFHQQGSLESQKRLTKSGLTLYCREGVFQPCDEAAAGSACKSHVVGLIDSSSLPREHCPQLFEENGALIIGYVEDVDSIWARTWKRTRIPQLGRQQQHDSLQTQSSSFPNHNQSHLQLEETRPRGTSHQNAIQQLGGRGPVLDTQSDRDGHSSSTVADLELSASSGSTSLATSIPTSETRSPAIDAVRNTQEEPRAKVFVG